MPLRLLQDSLIIYKYLQVAALIFFFLRVVKMNKYTYRPFQLVSFLS